MLNYAKHSANFWELVRRNSIARVILKPKERIVKVNWKLGVTNPICALHIRTNPTLSRLGDVVVSVLVTRPKGRGFKPGRGDGFLIERKIRSTSSLIWDVKPEAPCRKILRHVKDPCVAWLRCYVSKIQGHFSSLPWETARCLWCSQRALADDSGVLELRWRRTTGQRMTAVLGTLRPIPPSNNN
jgi:hypothetical protein